MAESFSQKTKTELSEINIKHRCCKRAFLSGILYSEDVELDVIFKTDNAALANVVYKAALVFSRTEGDVTGDIREDAETFAVRINKDVAEDILHGDDGRSCENCEKAYLRGIFCSCGTVTEPDRGYHLELVLKDDAAADELADRLTSLGFAPKKTQRKGRSTTGVYFKESEAVEDFLNFIGANRSAFELMNVKIYKDLRNNANRYANCDAANIDKTVQASRQQIDAILKLVEVLGYDMIPDELHQTIDLRIANPSVSLAELAQLHTPPITKSGVSHRLKKIMKLAQGIK